MRGKLAKAIRRVAVANTPGNMPEVDYEPWSPPKYSALLDGGGVSYTFRKVEPGIPCRLMQGCVRERYQGYKKSVKRWRQAHGVMRRG